MRPLARGTGDGREKDTIKMTFEPQTTTVQVSTPLERQQIQYVAEYCGLRQTVAFQHSSQLRLQLPSGEAITTRNAILREIVKGSKFAADLLGDQPLADALIWEWLAFCNQFSVSAQADLQKIHDHLATRTYLATPHKPSLADLVLATLVHRPVKNFPSGQAAEYRNLVRWYDLIQHTTPLTAHFPEVSIQKPGIPVVIPPDKEKAKASDAAAAKAQAAAKEPAQPTPALDSRAKPSDAAFTLAPNGQASGGKGATKAGKPGKGGQQGQQGAESSPTADSPTSAPATPSQPSEAPTEGKGKKAGKTDKAGKPAAAAKADAEPEFDALDVRVGRILSVDKHPNAESLYVESIDIGEDKPRQVVSGLVKFVAKEAMQDRLVLVVCNMKPAKMRDVMSYGMVLCASNAAHDQVDPLKPAEGAAVGEKVLVPGFEGEPEAQLNPKKKVFEKIAAHFKTSADGKALYKDTPFQTAAGEVTSSIGEGTIS